MKMQKQVKCARCKKTFWSPCREVYIIIAYKKEGKQESRVVKGARMNSLTAEEVRRRLEKELVPKEYDKVFIEPRITPKNMECQRCRNQRSAMGNFLKKRKMREKSKKVKGAIREIPEEEVRRIENYIIQRKIAQDYRKKQQEEQRKKMIVKKKKLREQKLKEATKQLEDVEKKKNVGHNSQ